MVWVDFLAKNVVFENEVFLKIALKNVQKM